MTPFFFARKDENLKEDFNADQDFSAEGKGVAIKGNNKEIAE